MATSFLRAEREPAEDFRTRMKTHEVNGVRELGSGVADSAIEVTRHIHALSAYISATLPERENTNYHAGERRIDLLNADITAGAFEAIGYLAALANFFATESACSTAASDL